IAATVSTSSNQITLTPSAALSASTTYNVTIVGGASGVKDLAGNALASNYTWSFTTAGGGGGTTYTLFATTSTPAIPLAQDGQGIELGMRFRSTQTGYINGIRYYKGAGTTGTHIGSLWSNTGTRLAQATFTNETASGWQQVLFSTPVAITAGVTYVASYFSPSGDYAATKPYFTQNIVNGPLIGLADGTDGGNGLYRYTTTSAFPNSTFQSSNYWVDVVFAPGTTQSKPAATSPVITSTNSVETEVYHYSLGQNYPNPAHKGTKIPFSIPVEEKVQLAVYDKSGKLVKMLVNGSQAAGKHIVNFNPGPLASGIYYYKIRAGEFTEVRKLVIR